MGRRRAQAPRHGRAGRVCDRAEDRRARGQPRLRARHPRPRRHPWGRPARRGRDRQPPYDRRDPALAPARRRRGAAAADRGARGDLHAALRLSGAERAPRGRGQEDGAEPAQRGRRLGPPEESRGHAPAAALDLGLQRGPPGGRRLRVAVGDARLAPRARLPHESLCRAPRVDRARRGGRARVGDAPRRARLRDRRARDQGRLDRGAAPAGRAPRPPALGARVQVGADDHGDATAEDPHPRRPHRRAESVGAARAGRGRRRDGLERHLAQRGGHQPQGHPRGRSRDRPARGRRDPAGRRPGAAADEADAEVPHACAVPALRRRRRQAGGRGHAPLPQSALRVARARDADPLGRRRDGHRGRRRAVRAPALERGAAALDARPLPPHVRAALSSSTATARSRPGTRSPRSSRRGSSGRSRASSSG